MHGLWKSNLSGYNRKGNRRKKNKRKYFIKDKGAAIIKRTGILSKKHKNGLHLDPLIYREENDWNEFLYNKPFWWSDIRFDNGRRKSYAKKMNNGQVRTSVRNWISKSDWEKERKTAEYEKTFHWYIS